YAPATTAIYTLSLHDALPIYQLHRIVPVLPGGARREDLDQVPVLYPSQGMDLAREPRLGLGIAAALQHLQRHLAGERRLPGAVRSEEHTSELQSPCNLVCRLL